MGVVAEIKDFQNLKKQLKKIEDAPEKTMKKMTRDAKKKVKAWVAADIAQVYGVSKAEVESKELGKVRVKGKVLGSLQFQYAGRTLTPTHFGMTPKTPNKDGYSLKATIIRGQTKTMGTVKPLTPKQRKMLARNLQGRGRKTSRKSPVMLLPVGKAGAKYIPFQRQSANRKDIKAVKTLSLPQMVSGRAEKQIQTTIRRGLSDRVDFYMKKYMK